MKRFSILKRAGAFIAAASLCLSATGAPYIPSMFDAYAEETSVKAVLTANKDGVIEISTAEEFKAFAENCVLDSNSVGKRYLLTADINVNGHVTVPSFSGTFDGNRHTVSGLRLNGSGSEQGLFRYVEKDGVVKNLTVSGSVSPSGSAEKCGGVAGVNRGRIISCDFSGAVKDSSDCGGIAGLNEASGLIANCETRGAVQARNLSLIHI